MPLPGICLAILDTTQIDGTEYKGDDNFDLPQSGTLIRLHADDENRPFSKAVKYNYLIGKRVFWAKYAEADAKFYDTELDKDVVFIQLDKLRGYE